MERLFLFFRDRAEYNRACDFFDCNMSDFTPCENRREFKCFVFDEECSINALEAALSDELTENDFEGFWFEAA